jgi:hypothetical protein
MYIDDMERGLIDQAKQIARLAELIRTLRHQRWPEGAPQNCSARASFDAETESIIQSTLTPPHTNNLGACGTNSLL